MLKLSKYFLEHPRITNMVVLLIIVIGIFSVMSLQRQGDPAVSYDIMKITASYPGASPGDVEINVTNKIEERLLEVENINIITSMSMENLSIIFVEVNTDAGDEEKTKDAIKDSLLRVTGLPKAVTEKPLIEELGSGGQRILEIALTGDIPELELRAYARELETILKEVNGVSKITKIGYRKREIAINVDIKKMKEQSISFGEIIASIKNRNIRMSGGTIESFVAEKNILTLAQYNNPLDVKKVIVRSNYEGYALSLNSIAAISESFEPPELLYRGNGKPGIALIAAARENADAITLAEDLRKKTGQFKKNLPPSVEVHIIYDSSQWLGAIFDILKINGLIGFVMVFLVLVLFFDFRSAFWAAFGIPFSILGALILFQPMGITLHSVAMGAMILVLGIVVDDAIVISEKIYALKQQGMTSIDACVKGTAQMFKPICAAVLTTIIAFLPLFFIPGIMGKFIVDIPVVVTLILGFSLLEAILFIPAHLKNAAPPESKPEKAGWFVSVRKWYTGILLISIRNRKKVMAGYVLLAVLIITAAVFSLKFVLNQQEDRDFFNIVIEARPGTSLERTAMMIEPVEEILRETISPEVLKGFSTQIGHHDRDVISAGRRSNWAMTSVYLEPAENRDISSEEIMDTMKPKFEELKKQQGFHRLSIEPLGALDTGKAVEVIYTGNNEASRNLIEKETLAFLKEIKGVRGIETSSMRGKEELQLRLQYKKMAQMGISAYAVAQSVRTAFDGFVVTSIQKDGEEISYRVRIKNGKKFSPENILNLPVANRENKLVFLKHFARLTMEPGSAMIRHNNGKRSVTLSADVDNRVIISREVNIRVREKFEKRVAAEPGLRMELGGQEEESSSGLRGFYYALIVAFISIFFILVVVFNSYLQPFFIMAIIPFAFAGVCATLMIHGQPMTLIALLGFLGLMGVVVNDTIVMISHLNDRCGREGVSAKVIAQGAAERFRPVILTTLTTFAGLLPTAYGIGGDFPALRPMVLTMAWGLVFATFVTLGFIPLLYSVKVNNKIGV
ncbi:MAG: efflux RND transporter permease subunit [bacterium]|nr:efflux RND transporter permease subunit [bacterium]